MQNGQECDGDERLQRAGPCGAWRGRGTGKRGAARPRGRTRREWVAASSRCSCPHLVCGCGCGGCFRGGCRRICVREVQRVSSRGTARDDALPGPGTYHSVSNFAP